MLDVNADHADLLYVLLLYSGKYTFLPDLYECLGREKMIEVMDIFAGSSISFPSAATLKKYARELSIYLRLKNVGPQRKKDMTKDLADEYMLDEQTIQDSYRKVEKIVEGDLGINVKMQMRRA